jgi:type I restriction-modification system DNA methylase subunit
MSDSHSPSESERRNGFLRLEVFGQDYNNEAFAVCCSDMMIKGQNPENIKFGDSFTQDGLPGQKFDCLLANPPFGVEWKPQADVIEREHEELGFKGRFGPRPAAHQRWLAALHHEHDLEDEAGGLATGWKRLSRCRRRCSITLAFRPTSGS